MKQSPDARAFIEEVISVCYRHRMTLRADSCGVFCVSDFSSDNVEELRSFVDETSLNLPLPEASTTRE